MTSRAVLSQGLFWLPCSLDPLTISQLLRGSTTTSPRLFIAFISLLASPSPSALAIYLKFLQARIQRCLCRISQWHQVLIISKERSGFSCICQGTLVLSNDVTGSSESFITRKLDFSSFNIHVGYLQRIPSYSTHWSDPITWSFVLQLTFKVRNQQHCSSSFKVRIPIREQTCRSSHLRKFHHGKWLACSAEVTEGIHMCDSLGLQKDCIKGAWPQSNTVHLGNNALTISYKFLWNCCMGDLKKRDLKVVRFISFKCENSAYMIFSKMDHFQPHQNAFQKLV